ncbi:MAG TPA: type 4a pilus biogenesis protein PilO, partial [Pyrinomonadaceae bacterium]|nr:type 4a pilus biogenesis protein PilO [Pyrinomonadaceae bacterium]
LAVTRFTPKDDFQQDYFSGKPVEIEVFSSYNNLGAFFAQMASYQRIVSITDFKLTRIDDKKDDLKTQGQTVSAQFLLTAYYSPTDKQQSAPKPAAPAGAPAPAAVANQVAAPVTK